MSRIFVLHENDAWVEPLRQALGARHLPFQEWFLDRGTVALDERPPQGVFYNRMSASSHTRGHRFGPELTRAVLEWLELNGRRTVNGSRAVRLEVDKLGQYAALRRAGIPVPRSVASVGKAETIEAARSFGEWPLILKPNRGGKGLGVQLFHGLDALAAFVEAPGEAAPLDGTWILQSYLRAPEPFITRLEFIGGEFHYAVRVDTSEGFELCPADACALPESAACPAEPARPAKFRILHGFRHPLIPSLRSFLRANEIEVAGVEFITDREGRSFVYDVNTNTNYNAEAEAVAKAEDRPLEGGMERLARFLGEELQRIASAAA